MTDTTRLTCGFVRDLLFKNYVQAGVYPNSLAVPGVGVASSSVTASIAPLDAGTQTTPADSKMTVTVLASGYLNIGNMVSGTSIPPNTYILEQLTGTPGGIGTYRVSNAITFASGAVTADGSGPWMYKDGVYATFQANIDGTSGAQSATVIIDVSNDGIHPVGTVAGTISLAGTLTASDGFSTAAAWKYVRARVTAVSGTGAVVTCKMGV